MSVEELAIRTVSQALMPKNFVGLRIEGLDSGRGVRGGDSVKADSLRLSAFVCSDSCGRYILGLRTVGSKVFYLAGLLPFQGGQGSTHRLWVLG